MAEPISLESRPIRIEVVFCPDRSATDSTLLELPAGSCVHDALQASGVLQRFVGIDPQADDGGGVGIWGRAVTPAQVLRDGDRVELYRRLVVDPKDARRLRQRHQARVKRGSAASPGEVPKPTPDQSR